MTINVRRIFVEELKRCADEIASTDLNFQTIWDMIEEKQHVDAPQLAVEGRNNESFTCQR